MSTHPRHRLVHTEGLLTPKTPQRSLSFILQRSNLNVKDLTDSPTSTSVPSSKSDPTNSPTLVKLRAEGQMDEHGLRLDSNVAARQRELVQKHQEAKSNIDNCPGIGGGRTLWPAMDDMRLSMIETVKLCIVSAAVVVGCCVIFYFLHGTLIGKLQEASHQLVQFPDGHALVMNGNGDMFRESLRQWHVQFQGLISSIQAGVNIDWRHPAQLFFYSAYALGLGWLFYFFIENVFSKNRLSPRRIKIWILLLVFIATWTALALALLLKAVAVEELVKDAVHSLNDEVTNLVQTEWDLQLYRTILQHWATKCLPPTAPGLISVLGVVQLRDLTYHLSYYCLPILTAILMPVAKVIWSLRALYRRTTT